MAPKLARRYSSSAGTAGVSVTDVFEAVPAGFAATGGGDGVFGNFRTVLLLRLLRSGCDRLWSVPDLRRDRCQFLWEHHGLRLWRWGCWCCLRGRWRCHCCLCLRCFLWCRDSSRLQHGKIETYCLWWRGKRPGHDDYGPCQQTMQHKRFGERPSITSHFVASVCRLIFEKPSSLTNPMTSTNDCNATARSARIRNGVCRSSADRAARRDAMVYSVPRK